MNDENAAEAPALEKSPSETDAEFAARTLAAEAPKAPKEQSPRQEFQSWLDRNHRMLPFPAVAELEKMLDERLGKLPA